MADSRAASGWSSAPVREAGRDYGKVNAPGTLSGWKHGDGGTMSVETGDERGGPLAQAAVELPLRTPVQAGSGVVTVARATAPATSTTSARPAAPMACDVRALYVGPDRPSSRAPSWQGRRTRLSKHDPMEILDA